MEFTIKWVEIVAVYSIAHAQLRLTMRLNRRLNHFRREILRKLVFIFGLLND